MLWEKYVNGFSLLMAGKRDLNWTKKRGGSQAGDGLRLNVYVYL